MTDSQASAAVKTVSILAPGGGPTVAGGYLTFSAVATPEPSSVALMLAGIGFLLMMRKRLA